MTDKRRLISLLPQTHQTADLTTFFGATVDEVFQPGTTQPVNGYVGHVPAGTNDFYVSEPTAERRFYQLEPAMISVDATDNKLINHMLSYPDLVAYLGSNGGNVSDHSRLFETDYYVWAPPINIDMLVNYRKYYWFGDVTTTADTIYSFNPVDHSANLHLQDSNLTTYVSDTGFGSVRSSRFDSGSWYIEFAILALPGEQRCGLANKIDDITLPTPPGQQTSGNAIVYSSQGIVYNDTGNVAVNSTLSSYKAGDIIGLAWSTVSNRLWFRVNDGAWDNTASDSPEEGAGGFPINALLSGGPAQALWTGDNGDQMRANFGATAFAYTPPLGFVGPANQASSADQPTVTLSVPYVYYTGDGHTTAFALPAGCIAVPANLENPTAFVDRTVVSATVSGATIVLSVAPPLGSEVLVCRTPDFVSAITGDSSVNVSDLNTQGVSLLTSSMRVHIIDCQHLVDVWDGRPWDTALWDVSAGPTYMVDGIGTSVRLTPLTSLVRGISPQYVTIDRSSADGNEWSKRNVWVHEDSFAWSGEQFPDRRATQPIIEFVRDLVMYSTTGWKDSKVDQLPHDPLFKLYDLNGVYLKDGATYPSSTFAGNRIFGFADASGTIDPVLNRAIRRDKNNAVLFNHDAVTHQYTYQSTSSTLTSTIITGLPCYATQAPGGQLKITPFWHHAPASTSQTKTNSFYQIPLNLSANPSYEDVSVISSSTWSGHFKSILTNQVGISGDPGGSNTYRDTARDPTVGTAIVQHHAPLLKTMLLAAAPAFDLLRAIRYAEVEYTRFRNKFARKLVDLRNRGVLDDTDAPSEWLQTALNALIVGHNNSFPFAFSAMGGGQYFIPPTPTGLAIAPGAVPALITDSTYNPPLPMLLGHDGSLTPAFNDWRDAIMLAMETLLFSTSPAATEPMLAFDLRTWIGTAFQTPAQGYSWTELAAVLEPMFDLWAQTSRIDYRTNNSYDPADPFTWNYRGVIDRLGNSLPGNWRAIYRFYYGTDAPHARPWEMLGYLSQPSWWVATYGHAPYTRANTALWHDLELGINGINTPAVADPQFARPGLHNFIPVDNAGGLLDPVAVGIVLTTVNGDLGKRPWQAGDHGPGENLWINSPSYRFALARASFLLKPARFVEQCWDASRIGYVPTSVPHSQSQWVDLETLTRPYNAAQYVHGEIDPTDGSTVVATGVSQWLADYLLSSGQASSSLGDAVRGLQVSLLHQMAGFIGSDVQVVADSFGLLPAEDVNVVLYQAPARSSEAYSGVIAEWTGHSWRMIGFDGRNPTFTIIPPNTTGPKGLISLATANEPSIVPWRSGTYYPIGILVEYQNSVYQCARGHSSGVVFELNFWSPRADLSTSMIRAPRVVTYLNGLNTTLTVPYGTEFTSYQEVADFLLGYERWLLARGWSFPSTSTGVLDWSQAVEEFLTWAQVQWAPGNFIALSPGQQQLQFSAPTGMILDVEDNLTGFYGLLDRAGRPIDQRNAVISRLDGNITLSAQNADIFLARLAISTIEHALVVSNTTIFADTVYLPLYNLRQERLRLSCSRAMNWQGRFEAPGFIIGNNTLVSNFEKAASDVRYMFDIEKADVPLLRDYARHVVGMQQRSYLSNLLLTPNDQFEFYQGMIQEKGAPGVFQKLARSQRASSNSTLEFLEEWAFRVARFGAPLDPFVTFQLSHTDMRDDPQFIRFTQDGYAPVDWIELAANDARWFDKPAALDRFFIERDDYPPAVFPTAGPVRLDEVANTALHLADLPTLYDPNTNGLPAGSLTWVYDAGTPTTGVNWYVDAFKGQDSNPGTAAAPFASLQRGHDAANPGDVVNVVAGTYTAPNLGTNVLEITRSGTAAAGITFQALPGATPLIIGSHSSAAIHISGAAYITLRGFELAGWNAQLLLSDVQTAAASGQVQTAAYNGAGIMVDQGVAIPHHITIENCIVHDFPGNGIFVKWADYITVRGCTTFSNAKYSPQSASGINILNSHSIDDITTYKTFVQQNISYDNSNFVTDAVSGNITAGHGIVITDNHNYTADGRPYAGRTLIENNLCYSNGGDGILVSNSSRIDIVFNTADGNQTNVNHAFGEIAAFNAVDVNVYNNIMTNAVTTVPLVTANGSLNANFTHNLGWYYTGVGSPLPGLSGISDPLFVATSAEPPDYRLRRGSHALGVGATNFADGRPIQTSVDLLGHLRNPDAGYDLGCYQSGALQPISQPRHAYTVLRSFDFGYAGRANSVLVIKTPTEDATLTTTRISFQSPMTLTSDDVGHYLILDGACNTTPELQGVQLITAVLSGLNSVDIQSVGIKGNSFLGSPAQQSAAPVARVLRPVRFATISAINPNYNFAIGDLVWIDDYNQQRWAVLQWNGTGWSLYREQPHRIDTTTIAETVIYSLGTRITGSQMLINQPVVNDVAVLDPAMGLICSIAEREIDFRTSYDPARYNAGYGSLDASVWGANEVGRVWWDLSAVRFLENYTDVLGRSADRDLAELQYRASRWAQIAPNTTVGVYEWVESSIDPITYSTQAGLPGTVYNADAPAWVVDSVYDPTLQRDVTRYYFWVAGLTTVPNVAFRNSSVATVATAIENPQALNIPWMSAVAPDALLVSGMLRYLDDTTTVMKVRLLSQPENVGRHDQWVLLRPQDDTSLPPDFMWDKLRDSLAGFAVQDATTVLVPDPQLPAFRNTGISDGQSMFRVPESIAPIWQYNKVYYYGDQVNNNGLVYVCVVTGISAPSPVGYHPTSPVLPGSGPSGFGSTILDNTVLWAYSGTDGSRQGLLDARAAFIASVNNILAATPVAIDQSADVATIRRQTPYELSNNDHPPFLAWAQYDVSYAYEPPPRNEWDVEVHTLSQRNALLINDRFQQAITSRTALSVLLNGYASPIPQWSIWLFDPLAAARVMADHPDQPQSALITHADLIFSLKTSYEYKVTDESDMYQLVGLNNNDRVLVTNSTTGNGFWVIYRVLIDADQTATYNLWRMQTYDTSSTDFVASVDWYAPTINPLSPPVVTYATTLARDKAEGTNPTNLFVRILNDGTGRFIWTRFNAGIWSTVAIQHGTLKLTDAFTDPLRPIHGVSTSTSPQPLKLTDVKTRDGSWEMRILVHALRYSKLLSNAAINQLWFDMVNFVHVQQDDVDWAFKTSFMTLSGINAPMTQTPVQTADQTNNLIDYINEVKPYRVKVRESTVQYRPDLDTINPLVTDFDNPLYLDPTTKTLRPLDPTNVNDVAILQTQPWAEWYQQYQNGKVGSPVRSFLITLLFDRISGTSGNWDMAPWDLAAEPWDTGEGNSGAAYRILTADPDADLNALLNLSEKQNTINGFLLSTYTGVDDGGTLVAESYDVSINPSETSQPGGYDLRAPYYAANHPEERVPFGADDGLQITVTADPLAGAPPQIIKVFDIGTLTGTTTTLFFDLIAQSSAAILVFCDGVRAVQGTDYTVDHFNRTITLNLTVNGAKVNRCTIHAFSLGGTSAITEQHFLSYGTNSLALNATTPASNVWAAVNGMPLPASGYTVSGSSVTLASAPANGSDVALAVFSGGVTTACTMHTQTLVYNNQQSWTLQYPDTQTVPEHAGTIVEVNGLRLTPPTTFYGSMTVGHPWMYLPLMPTDTTTVAVYVDNVLYTAAIPICSATDPNSAYPFNLVLPGQPPAPTLVGRFVFFDNLLVALDSTFISQNIVVVMQFAESPANYSVHNGVLTIYPAVLNTATINVTTFSNAGCMGIKTVSFDIAAAEQHIIPQPFASSYAWVTMDGYAIAPDDDYTLKAQAFATPNVYFTAPVIAIPNTIPGSVVATIFTGNAAREQMMWMYTTKTPAFNRMIPAPLTLQDAGWDTAAFDSQGFDNAQLYGIATNAGTGKMPLFNITDRFESVRLSPYMAGTLGADLRPNDSSFTVNLFIQPVASKLQENNPLPLPDTTRNRPGAIWIDNERIEYFGYSRTGNIVTLSGLRRATRGTSMGVKRLVLTGVGTGAPQTFSFAYAGIVDVTISDIVQTANTFSVAGTTTVTVSAAVGAYVVVGLTIAASHLAGTNVWHGQQVFGQDIPIGPMVGNRELQPMHLIIAGG